MYLKVRMLEIDHQLGGVNSWREPQCELHVSNAQIKGNFKIRRRRLRSTWEACQAIQSHEEATSKHMGSMSNGSGYGGGGEFEAFKKYVNLFGIRRRKRFARRPDRREVASRWVIVVTSISRRGNTNEEAQVGKQEVAQLTKLELVPYIGPKISLPKVYRVHVFTPIQNSHLTQAIIDELASKRGLPSPIFLPWDFSVNSNTNPTLASCLILTKKSMPHVTYANNF